MKQNMPRTALPGAMGLICLLFISMQPAWAESNISDAYKYAWSENAGWHNWKATHGQATVGSTYLVGYVWAERIGWIKLGANAGGPYANTNQTNWGVNKDGSGNLSGYAWSENAGWINFAPTHGGVSIDLATGDFSGYAWGERIGWIKLSGTALDSTAYKVKTDPTTYTVNGTAGAGGSIDPSSRTVTHGNTTTFTVTPNAGYSIASVTGCGGSLSGNTYTTGAITGTCTVNATFSTNTYTVTFDKQGGSGGSAGVNATYGSAMPAATAPTRTGYTFGGYYTGTGGSGTQYYTADMASARNWNLNANTTLYAKWTANTCTVTFNANGGAAPNPATKQVTYDATYGDLATTTRDNYTFDGWFTQTTGGTLVTSGTTVTTASNHTLYAHWSASVVTIDPEQRGHAPEAVSGRTVTVTADAGTSWTAASNANWITVTGGTSGTGGGQVTYRLSENGYPNEPRTGTISIADKTFTVTQGSFDSTFTDGPADGCNMEIPNRQAGDPYILCMSSQESGGALPPDTTFPWGLFDFKVVDVPPGGTVRIAFTMTEDIPAGSTFYKYDAGTGVYTPYANVEGLDDGDNTFVLLLTDGGEGDQDGVVNGEIMDPGNVGVSGTPPIPTVSEWGMILLALVLAGIALGRMRKRTAGTLLF